MPWGSGPAPQMWLPWGFLRKPSLSSTPDARDRPTISTRMQLHPLPCFRLEELERRRSLESQLRSDRARPWDSRMALLGPGPAAEKSQKGFQGH